MANFTDFKSVLHTYTDKKIRLLMDTQKTPIPLINAVTLYQEPTSSYEIPMFGVSKAIDIESEKVQYTNIRTAKRKIVDHDVGNAIKLTRKDVTLLGDSSIDIKISELGTGVINSVQEKINEKLVLGITGTNYDSEHKKYELSDKETVPLDFWASGGGGAADVRDTYVKYGMNVDKSLRGIQLEEDFGYQGPLYCLLSSAAFRTFRSDPKVYNSLSSDVKSLAYPVHTWDRIVNFIVYNKLPSFKTNRTINGAANTPVTIEYAYLFYKENIAANAAIPLQVSGGDVSGDWGSQDLKVFGSIGATRIEEGGVTRIECLKSL